VAWPLWWTWDLELTPHLEKRMEDRQFSEIDLRTMLHSAAASSPMSLPDGLSSTQSTPGAHGKS